MVESLLRAAVVIEQASANYLCKTGFRSRDW